MDTNKYTEFRDYVLIHVLIDTFSRIGEILAFVRIGKKAVTFFILQTAHIEMDSYKRTRMIWATDFSNVIREEYPEIYAKHNNGEEIDEEKPCLFFERINDNQYDVKLSKLVLLPQIEEDIESELSEEGISAKLLKEGRVIE